ncbi:MAG: GNAT family N-acetyltransferase [Spirochaetia bacterium]|nr:GNAT family N-acetyltransferase [Spirochaetia bacterium]
MSFEIGTDESLKITNKEISNLINAVYVKGGYMESLIAAFHHRPVNVRKRGYMLCARYKKTGVFAGMVILVNSNSPAAVFANDDECEMHFLGVREEFRNKGLGRLLIKKIIEKAKKAGFVKMILNTQTTMRTAQSLYESFGFLRNESRDFSYGKRKFIVYEKAITDT